MSHSVGLLMSLAVEVGQGGERTRGEEARPCVLNAALHAPFFIESRGRGGARSEVVVGQELQQRSHWCLSARG